MCSMAKQSTLRRAHPACQVAARIAVQYSRGEQTGRQIKREHKLTRARQQSVKQNSSQTARQAAYSMQLLVDCRVCLLACFSYSSSVVADTLAVYTPSRERNSTTPPGRPVGSGLHGGQACLHHHHILHACVNDLEIVRLRKIKKRKKTSQTGKYSEISPFPSKHFPVIKKDMRP